jgi:hypothetical protein
MPKELLIMKGIGLKIPSLVGAYVNMLQVIFFKLKKQEFRCHKMLKSKSFQGNIYEGMWVNDIRHGQGTMRWFNKNQTYNGQWENGIQHGVGEHNWYLARIDNTQYALRNTYYGDFKYGKRHGKGTFIYASGAKYEGEWMQNLKHGWVKF